MHLASVSISCELSRYLSSTRSSIYGHFWLQKNKMATAKIQTGGFRKFDHKPTGDNRYDRYLNRLGQKRTPEQVQFSEEVHGRRWKVWDQLYLEYLPHPIRDLQTAAGQSLEVFQANFMFESSGSTRSGRKERRQRRHRTTGDVSDHHMFVCTHQQYIVLFIRTCTVYILYKHIYICSGQ